MSNNSFKVKNSLNLTPIDVTTITSPEAGDLACDSTDNNKIKRYNSLSSAWEEVGAGGAGGGLDTYYTQSMEELADVSGFSTGNNATFLGGGTIQGTLALESVAPISGTKSLSYIQAAGSLNDYFASELIDIELKQQNNDSGMTLYFEYDGADNDGRFVVWDVTNSRQLNSEVSFVNLTGKATRYSLSFYVPTTCTQIRWGYQVLVENIGAELVVDDVEISTNPFILAELSNDTDWEDAGLTTSDFTGFGTMGSIAVESKREGSDLLLRGVITIGTPSAVQARMNIKYRGTTLTSASGVSLSGKRIVGRIWRDAASTSQVGNILINPNVSYFTFSGQNLISTATNPVTEILGTSFTTGATFYLENVRIPISGWENSTPHVLTPVDTFSTDTAPLTYASSATYTLSTLANAPVGTFITYTYASGTNTRTQTTSAPTQTTSSMNTNGIQVFTRAHNATSTFGNPAVVAIQIGKNYKGTSLTAYKTSGKPAETSSLDWYRDGIVAQGFEIKEYNPESGILLLDGGIDTSTGSTVRLLTNSDATSTSNGSCYVTINASKSAALTAVPTPLVAYLKDVKASGTAGGTFTSGAWQTRTLNTVEGDSSFVTLASNQFTLPAGSYEIEASAPAFGINLHKAKLRNITDSTDDLIGNSSYAVAGANATTSTTLVIGTITLTTSKTFEIQHRSSATLATNGFGLASSFAVSEIYTQVKIKKVR